MARKKTNVHLFPGCKMPKKRARAQPREQVIAVLEEMLEWARNGELQSVALAGVLADDNTIRNFDIGETAPTTQLIGALSLLQKDVADAAENEDEDEEEEYYE